MKQVLIKQGQAVVEDVPAPLVEANTVLVQVHHSCISTGTEMSGLKTSSVPLWQRAIRHPEKIKKVVDMALEQGISRTSSIVQGKLESGEPTGYSATGTVIAVGSNIDDLQMGDRVACAGAQCAHHAEIIRVPRNLTVPLPDSVDFSLASTVTLGAIALQGVRRAQPTLGETFVVLGLGVLGQLTAQLLRANGCRIIGTDLDRQRIERASALGMDIGLHPDDGHNIEQVARFTEGLGADGVIITAATPSDAVMSTAFQMCRKKGRVVLVGDVGLHLNRADFYKKELDFFISTSYGPGRYDQRYEEEGFEYPVAYVRWTENRNMGEYLRLIAEGHLKIEPLVSATYPVTEATTAYNAIRESAEKPLIVLLSYPQSDPATQPVRTIPNPLPMPATAGQIRVAIVGAGSFAKGMHLPNLQAMSDLYHLQAVVSRTGHNAIATARQFGSNYSTTDYQEVLQDSDVDAVLICTRHDLHAGMTLVALQAGKHVFVEKPLALTATELDGIRAFYAEETNGTAKPMLLTGFNRRFSPHAQRLQALVANRSNPMLLNYRINAGYIPLDSWVHTESGGGRNRGEACHIYDLFTYLTGSKVTQVQAQAISPQTAHYSGSDNFVATLTFEDGSVATLTYTALGSRDYPKENLEVYVDGKVLVMEDYQSLQVFGAKTKGLETKLVDKGHQAEVQAFAQALKQGSEWPIPLWQQLQATDIALQVATQLGEV
ncbi:bi-domain-containing oxidoreductase [Acaryochloris sp. 'Moss Beach']|uniref:bi-domain-containing oxidoreductase n=1 Tax=Acaryochloris sp. 'Moss Beach' TaxID=2740837 RepID=UPI001F452620|nr:bi-domain-containing oxidoreductase [Acaryochloris sp. 'Moss Beach']UJB69465.1 bi-domain-containing oxidoreductase [Acaryochloris sp. 'Moss Beach']